MFTDLAPSEISFQDELFSSRFSVIFLVIVRETTCVMKVHHGRGPGPFYAPTGREKNIFICESSAYKRLHETGLCDRGIVPKFYEVIEPLDPTLCQPHLKMFLNDEYLPTAIFLEYIPDMRMLHWANYTEERKENFLKGIQEIHRAFIQHSDIHPRNMMVVEGDPKRAIWIDFDRAQTFDMLSLNERQRRWIDFEHEIVKDVLDRMAADAREGELNRTAKFYY